MQNILDKAISYISPSAGLERLQYRSRIEIANNSMSTLFGDTTGYITADSPTRATRGWRTTRRSADADVLPKHNSAIASSRDLYMNTPLAAAILRRLCTNVVGGGLFLQSRIDREALGLSDDAADKWERDVERRFRIYAESTQCDAERQLNFYQLQALAYLSPLLSGDLFFMLPWVETPNWPFETRIQLIEADLCSTPNYGLDTYEAANGIEVGPWHEPVAYHFATRFDDSNELLSRKPVEWVRIPAFDAASGRQNVYHIFHKTRPGQRRGMPFLASVFVPLKQITRLSDAKLMQNLIQTFFTVFVKDSVGNGGMTSGYTPEDSTNTEDSSNPNSDFQLELGSGNIVDLPDKKDIIVADPKRTDPSFKQYFDSLVNMISATCNIPEEQLMLHFQSSYSASRAAIIEGYKYYKSDRAAFALSFNQPIYEEWLTEQVIKGYIKAPGFLDDPITKKYWCKAKWCGSGMGQIDPLKETKAAIEKINANLSNHEEEYAAMSGGDWEAAFNRRIREYKVIKDSGVQPMPTKTYQMDQDSDLDGNENGKSAGGDNE